MKRPWAMAACLLMLGGVGLWWRLAADKDDAAPQTAELSKSTVNHQSANWPAFATPSSAPVVIHDSPLLPTEQYAAAAVSMTNARERGDDRSPPIEHSPAIADAPTPQELADPARYQAYEQRQQIKLYQSYVDASKQALPQLANDIARAKAQGDIPAQQIAKMEEKQRRMQQMDIELQRKIDLAKQP